MKKLSLFILVLFVLAGGALVLAPRFIKTETLVAQAEKSLSGALGRSVTIGDMQNLKLFPVAGLDITDLEIANAPGMTDPYFIKVGAAEVRVRLLPMLLPPHNIEIGALILDQPDIRLEKRKDGTANWVIEKRADDSGPVDDKDAAGVPTDNFDARLGDVRIAGGTIVYRDGGSDQVFEANQADLKIGLDRLSSPLSITGGMMFQDTPASLDVKLTSPASLIKNESSIIDLKFTVGDNAVDTQINTAGGDLRYTGRLNIDAPSLRALLRVLGMQIEAASGFNNLVIKGNISGSDTRLSFDQAAFAFDAITGAGALAFDWGKARGKATGEVAFDSLDLRPYTPAPSPDAQAARKNKEAAFPPWSDERIDFSFLNTVDLDVTGSTETITLHTLNIGKSAIRLRVDNGKLRLDLNDLTLYDGSGKGRFELDAARGTPRLVADFTMNGLDAASFAADALGVNRLNGTGNLAIDLTTDGTSQAAFMRNLQGTGDFNVDRGTIEGVNLAQMVAGISDIVNSYKSGKIDPASLVSLVSAAQGDSAVTEFETLKAGFTARNGVLTSRDVSIIAPFFGMDGDGTVDLPNQQINLTLNPSVAEDAGRSGRSLGAPIRVTGSFNDPKVRVDTSSLVKNAAESKVRELLREEGIETEEGESLEDVAKRKATEKIFDLFGQ